MLRADFRLSDDQIRAWRASDRDLVEFMASEIESGVRERIEHEDLITGGPKANAGAGQPLSGERKMKSGLRRAVLAVAVFASVPGVVGVAGAQGTPQVLNFDQFATSGNPATAAIPVGYGGFTWSRFFIGNGASWTAYFHDTGFQSGSVSGPNFLGFGSVSNPSVISSSTPFVFSGGYFTAGDYADGFNAVVVSGYSGTAQVFTQTLILPAAPVYYTFPALSITELRMNGNTPANVPALDNLAFNGADGQITTAPEPSSFALLGTGLLGLVPIVRRRKRAA